MQLYNGDCLEVMKDIADNSVDLTVTSPPYDNLRTYNGNIDQWSFDKFQQIAQELYRVTKAGGVIVWVVGDATINGSETGTSFKQALYFKEIGFSLHDTMIWNKPNAMPNIIKTRYRSSFEYMFIFSKGKPKATNMLEEKCKYAGVEIKRTKGNMEAIGKQKSCLKTNNTKIKSNIWDVIVAGTNYGHPAVFPEQLANDHIISWSNEQDIILDPFMGSGTTGVACQHLNRNFIGIELDENYFNIAKDRIESAHEAKELF